MDYSPPPLFKQGHSAFVRLVFFLFLALCLLLIDSRLQALSSVRRVVAIVLYPLERAVLLPRDAAYAISDYFASATSLSRENETLRKHSIALNQQAQRSVQLGAENTQLRKLLNLKEITPVPSLAAEIQYDTRDPYSQRVIINRGSQDGLKAGLPVIDERGVIGQVTRVYLLQSEVTLLTDKDQSIPVQVVRNGVRSVAYGGSRAGLLDLRFMAASADLQQGDILMTSGLDGTYPPGLPVAKVIQIERKVDTAFAKVFCEPAAGIGQHRHVLILQYAPELGPRPSSPDDKDTRGRRGRGETKAEKAERSKAAAAAASTAAPAVTPPPAKAP